MPEAVGRYKILRTLGQGAMGVVYLARDERLKRDVAIKVLSEQYSRDPSHRRRFLTEAQSASALNHPGIITIYEIGTDQDRDFIAMEYVQGRSLQEILAERGALPVGEIVSIGIQLANALAAAHRAGIVHRDLKPGNVMLTPEGRVKTLDFGLARQREEGGPGPVDPQSRDEAPTMAAMHTQPGMILGTPGFMAPEQARGDQASPLSDQFSLGCILHAMATGKAPFSGESVVDVLHSVLHEDPKPIDRVRSDLPQALQQILRRCLQKRPEDRYDDAAQVEAALREVRETMTPRSGPGTAPVVHERARAARRKLALIIGGVVALAAAATVVLLVLSPFTGAKTMTVSVQDDAGNRIVREIPTVEYRKRLAVFPFEVLDADSSSSWLSYAPSALLAWDLLQDHRLLVDELRTILGTSLYADEAKKAGYDQVIGTPLHLKRQVAQSSNCTHMVTGTIRAEAESIRIRVELHAVGSGRLETAFGLAGSSLFPIIDEVSLRLRKQLGAPEEHLREWPDLPVTDITTGSMTALEYFCRASVARDIERDTPAAARFLERAVTEDPAFVMAHWGLFGLLQFADQTGSARQAQALNALMTHIGRLPERLQFAVRAGYFESQGDNEKTLAVLRMWRDLYPHDIMPHGVLLMVYRARGATEQVIATLRTLIELEPGNPQFLLQAGEELQRTGEFEAARGYFETYTSRHPDDPKAQVALGELLQKLGDHEAAKTHLERALLVAPRDPDVRLALAKCEFNLGDLAAMPKALHSVLTDPLSPDEYLEMSIELSEHYELTGQLERARQVCVDALREADDDASPLWTMLARLSIAKYLAQEGLRERALATISELESGSPLAFRPLVQLATLAVYLELAEPQAAEQAADTLAATIEAKGLQILRFQWLEAMGRIREQEQDFTGACDFYLRAVGLEPSRTRTRIYLGRCYRQMGKLDQAKESLELALTRSPHDPRALLERSLLADAQGRRTEALEHLDRALEVWANADSSHAPARGARETRAAWMLARTGGAGT